MPSIATLLTTTMHTCCRPCISCSAKITAVTSLPYTEAVPSWMVTEEHRHGSKSPEMITVSRAGSLSGVRGDAAADHRAQTSTRQMTINRNKQYLKSKFKLQKDKLPLLLIVRDIIAGLGGVQSSTYANILLHLVSG